MDRQTRSHTSTAATIAILAVIGYGLALLLGLL